MAKVVATAEHDELVQAHGPVHGLLPTQCEWTHELRAGADWDERKLLAVVCGSGRHVLNVVVRPLVRGQRLAPKLVREALRTVRRLGHTYAETYASNDNVESLKALMRVGFRVVGTSYEQGRVFVTLTCDLGVRGRRRAARGSQRR